GSEARKNPMEYDLVLRGARVLDPAQNIDGLSDVAVTGGRIVALAENIDGSGRREIHLTGKLLTPGWIDIHAHLYPGSTTWGIRADAHYLSTGVTTAVDAGSAGWANLQGYLDFVVAPARTRFLSFVHVCGIGLTYGPLPELADMRYADAERTAFVIEHFAEHCVGVKVRQGEGQVADNGVEPLRLAVQAAEWAEVPVMVHIGRGVPLPDVLSLMRPRDIVTHCYQGTGDGILDRDASILAEVQQARKDGILFDVGHGGGSFDYGVATGALARGFVSDVISTDLHAHSWDVPVESLPHTASKLLNLGVPIESIVRQCTANAAFAIGREDELGTLRVGSVADIAVFDIEEGTFQYRDVRGRVEEGNQQIRAWLCVRAGVPYSPEELRDEVAEDLERARFNKGLNSKRLGELGWSKA
ncbi:MAG: amidohydrolase/deacetylase family metallohydrolase, partial [Candidatus Latescibacterota bacterium]|nr:amidohydrolase/deacetylase family metallohydrolase [Candidatus Latescibacterota bacterium]